MNKLLKAIALCAVCGTTSVFAVELPINGQFAKDAKGNLALWRALAPREGVNMEVTTASNGKDNALFVETDGKSYPIGNIQHKIRAYKKLKFSIRAKGSGGFAVSLLYYTEARRYITTVLLFEGRPGADNFKEFTGSVDVPEKLDDKNVEFANILLLSFSNSQIIFENAVLDGEERQGEK